MKIIDSIAEAINFPKEPFRSKIIYISGYFRIKSSPVLIIFLLQKLNTQWAQPYWGPSFTHLNIWNWKYSYLVSQHSFCPVFIHTANYSQNIILCEHAVIMSPSSNLTSHLIFLHNTGVIREGRTWTRTAEKALCKEEYAAFGVEISSSCSFSYFVRVQLTAHISVIWLSP